MPNFLKILPNELADGLTTAEAGLIRAAGAGEMLDLRTGDPVMDNPRNAGLWEPGRTIRGEFLSWICRAMPFAHTSGISVYGALVAGPLNLDSFNLKIPLGLVNSRLDDVILLDGYLRSVNLAGSICGELVADGLRTDGDFVMDRLTALGEVRLVGASVRGLYARGARFETKGVYAMSADRLTAGANVDLTGAFSSGWVRMLDAKVKGSLILDRLRVHNYGAYSVSLGGLAAGGGLYLRDAELAGEFQMPSASIGGVMAVSGSWCRNPGDIAFGASGVEVGLDAWFDRVSMQGTLDLSGARVGGSLSVTGSEFDGAGLVAISAARVYAGSVLHVADSRVRGGMQMDRATVGGSMYVERSKFEGGPAALGLDGARVKGVLSIGRGTEVTGVLSLTGAKAGRLAEDGGGSWPEGCELRLYGFEYGWLHGLGGPPDAATRIEWLRRMPKKPFRRGPYVQLARVLHLMGLEADMRLVVEAMYEDMKAAGEFGLARRAWRWLKKGKGDLGLPGM